MTVAALAPRDSSRAANPRVIDAQTADDRSILGRERELTLLAKVLDPGDHDVPSSAAVVGEPGIGKTALLSAACRMARETGALVAAGRGGEFEVTMPFGLAVDAFDPVIGALDSAQLARLGDDLVAELALVFPSQWEHRQRATDLAAVGARWHQAVRLGLEMLSENSPLFVCLDDVQWADDASLELVAYLLHRLPAAVPMVLGYRSGRVPSILTRAVASAVRAESAVVIEPEPLTEQQALTLIGNRLDQSGAAAAHRQTGGNPFYLRELVCLRHADGTDPVRARSDREEADLPRAVQAQIGAEVERASPQARRMLQAGAVLGERFSFDLASEVTSLGGSEGVKALDELLGLDLVQATESPGHFAFRHPIVRRAVYLSAGAGARLVGHERAARALTRVGAPLPDLARHVEHSAAAGDGAAAELLAEAASEVVSRAPATAARWLSRALSVLPAPTPRARRVELLLALGAALSTEERLSESRAALADALDLMPGDGADRRAVLLCSLARVDHSAGVAAPPELVTEMQAHAKGSVDSAATVALELELAFDRCFAADARSLIDAGSRARARADASGEPAMSAAALSLLAFGHGCGGSPKRASNDAEAAARSLDAVGEHEVARRPEALIVLAAAELGLDRLAESARHAERAVEASPATRVDGWSVLARCVLAAARLAQGRVADAEASAQEALAAVGPGGERPRQWALSVGAQVAVVLGDTATAGRRAEQATGLRARRPVTLLDRATDAAWVLALIQTGRLQVVDDGAERGDWRLEAALLNSTSRAAICRALSDGERVAGNLERAEEWVKRAEAAAMEAMLPGAAADAALARGALDLARGDPRSALELSLDATTGFTRLGRRIDAARASILTGRVLAGLGERACAIELLAWAHSTLAASGARRAQDEAARELRRLGHNVGARRASRPGLNGHHDVLSARELDVVDAVARGMRNREIAEHLFISPKTVERHLSRIFEKLEVSSRTELVALSRTAIGETPTRR